MTVHRISIQFIFVVVNSSFLSASIYAQPSNKNKCPNRKVEVVTGKNCPCVSVDSSCTIIDSRPEYVSLRGKNCSKLKVEADGDGNYPGVEVEFSWKMCNENSFDILLNDKGKFFDWARVKGSKKYNLANPRFPLGGTTLVSGACLKKDETLTINTGNRYNIATQLEGNVLNPSGQLEDPRTDYCYAYTSDNVNIKRSLCDMNTEVECKVTGTQTSCQEYIDTAGKRDLCLHFDATFSWKACNNENYDMRIFSSSSDVKLARTVNGRSRTNVVGQVQDLNAGQCQLFHSEVRNINSCSQDKLFFSVNVQGSRPNGKYWYECQDYSFQSLQFSAVCPEFSKAELDSDVEKINSGIVSPLDSNCARSADGSISLAYNLDGGGFPGVKYSGAAIFSNEKVLLVDDQIIRVAPQEWEVCSKLIDDACEKVQKTNDLG